MKLYEKIKVVLKRKHAVSKPLGATFTKLNQIIKGWINYFKIGNMKHFLEKFGQWLRHKIRVIIIKQWKITSRIYTNLQRLNKAFKCNFDDESIYKVANSRLGWYKRSGMDVVNYLLNHKVLEIANKKRVDQDWSTLWITILVVCNQYRCSAVYETRMYGAMGGTKILIIFSLPYYTKKGCFRNLVTFRAKLLIIFLL